MGSRGWVMIDYDCCSGTGLWNSAWIGGTLVFNENLRTIPPSLGQLGGTHSMIRVCSSTPSTRLCIEQVMAISGRRFLQGLLLGSAP